MWFIQHTTFFSLDDLVIVSDRPSFLERSEDGIGRRIIPQVESVWHFYAYIYIHIYHISYIYIYMHIQTIHTGMPPHLIIFRIFSTSCSKRTCPHFQLFNLLTSAYMDLCLILWYIICIFLILHTQKKSIPKFLLRQQDCRYFWLQEVSVLSPFGIPLEEWEDKLKYVQVFIWLCIWEGCKWNWVAGYPFLVPL